MPKSGLISLLILLFLGTVRAQQIEIQIEGVTGGNANLYELRGENIFLRDSISSDGNGLFTFTLDRAKYQIGFHRLKVSQNKWVDFLNDGKDVSLKTSLSSILDSMLIINSESNQIYYSFVKLNKQYKTKSEILIMVLSRFPKDDEYYQSTKLRLFRLQQEYQEFVSGASQKNSKAYISEYLQTVQLPILDMNISIEKQLEYLKAHALDNINFNAADLTYSDAFVNKSIEYLTYYSNPKLPKELLEKEFIKATDSLLNRARVNQIVYQHIVNYLINGFKQFGFDKILDYIVDNYVIKDDLCLDGKTENLIKRRIDQAKIFKIGALVPNIILPDSSGRSYDLSQEKAGKVLLVFYASWCPHCREILPKINELYQKQGNINIQVVAISLDSKREDWLNFLRGNTLSFANISDLKGWDSPVSTQYLLYATPTMFLIDNDKKIIAKPTTFEEVKELFAVGK